MLISYTTVTNQQRPAKTKILISDYIDAAADAEPVGFRVPM